jgi:IS1 family transposase
VVEQIRSDVCRRDPASTGEPHARVPALALASGRDVRKAQRRDGLLWRAVDHEGEILESYVTKTRDKDAALTFMNKALKRHGSPEAITTDGLRSYKAAMKDLGCQGKQGVGRWTNNRCENSHLSFRRRERTMCRFKRMKTLQKFASVHANIHNHFALERHLTDRQTYKERRSAAVAEWQITANWVHAFNGTASGGDGFALDWQHRHRVCCMCDNKNRLSSRRLLLTSQSRIDHSI